MFFGVYKRGKDVYIPAGNEQYDESGVLEGLAFAIRVSLSVGGRFEVAVAAGLDKLCIESEEEVVDWDGERVRGGDGFEESCGRIRD